MSTIMKFVIFILLAFAMTACQVPEELTFEEVCQVSNNDIEVVVDGYFSLGPSNYCSDVSGDLRCGLLFHNFPNGNLKFSADVIQGRRRNQMHPLESGYLEEDLQIKTADGDMIGVGDHVKVTGEMLVSEEVCLMYVDKIEMIDQ